MNLPEARLKRICDFFLRIGGLRAAWMLALMVSFWMSYNYWTDFSHPIGVAIGLAFAIAALAMGAPIVLVVMVPIVGVAKYMLFLLPLFKVIGNMGWFYPLSTWLVGVLWESVTLTVPLVIAWALMRGKARAWVVFLVVAGAHAGLSVWVPRPYNLSLGAIFFEECPNLIWWVGADMTGGLFLGTIAMLAAACRYERSIPSVAWPSCVVACAVIVTVPAYGTWERARYTQDDRFTQQVIIGQPNIRPFLGNYTGMSQYMIGPAVLLSSLGPDLIVMPEGVMQASYDMDPRDEGAVEKRHLASKAIAMISPTTQIAFGVRDFKTARTYYTDIDAATQERVSRYKDLERRLPLVDVMPKALGKRIGWGKDLDIMPPGSESSPTMTLTAGHNGIQIPMARAIIAMSGEIREGRNMLHRVLAYPDAVAIVHPTISGWMGENESRGAVYQARARAIELGTIVYRAGQTHGTEVFVPWGKYAIEGFAIKPLGGGTIQVGVYVPKIRPTTPYVQGWNILGILCFPAFAILLLLGWCVPVARRDILGVR